MGKKAYIREILLGRGWVIDIFLQISQFLKNIVTTGSVFQCLYAFEFSKAIDLVCDLYA